MSAQSDLIIFSANVQTPFLAADAFRRLLNKDRMFRKHAEDARLDPQSSVVSNREMRTKGELHTGHPFLFFPGA